MNSIKLHTVLRPPAKISQVAEEFSRTNFADDNMGYCLGTQGHLPHITLIQTAVTETFNIHALYEEITALHWDSETPLTFGNYYHNEEKPYNGVEIENDATLQNLHEVVLRIHQHHKLAIENACGLDFWPHMTFAKTPKRLLDPVTLPKDLQGSVKGWTLEFGYRGEHSVYLGPYNP